jgi:hypothetical protein
MNMKRYNLIKLLLIIHANLKLTIGKNMYSIKNTMKKQLQNN